eukprot:jgi/Botrbrau1/4187/Bobra.0192s0046.1
MAGGTYKTSGTNVTVERSGAAARAAQDNQTLCANLLPRQQPPVALQDFAFETFGGVAC